MTASRHLLPLRIPELGPSLGKLLTGTRRGPASLSLEAERQHLVTKIIEAGGEARRMAARDDREGALAALDRPTWLAAWDEAVAAVAGRVVARVNAQLDAQAYAVRMPRRRRRRLALDAPEQRALSARLGSAGVGLVTALDELAEQGARALPATSLERDAVEAWNRALRTAARRLEQAWMALEDAVEQELARWQEVVAQVARWRRPLWPVWAVAVVAIPAAAWFGLVLGGYLPSPQWLARLWAQLVP